jgi:hypothetical protein
VVGSGYRWSHETGAQRLDGLADNQHVSTRALSADGRTVAGIGRFAEAEPAGAFRWTADSGFERLGVLPNRPAHTRSEAADVSADGLVVVGNSSVGQHPYMDDRAVVCDDVHGPRELEKLLADEYGLTETHPWGLGFATAISADRRVIAGTTREGRARGNTPSEAWIVYLNEPLGPPAD